MDDKAMKDPNAMTVEECQDELARNAGYKPTQNHWHHPGHGCCHFNSHPIPTTLDEAAKLPEGWKWSIWTDIHRDVTSIRGQAWEVGGREVYAIGDNRKECEFRLRVAVERLARQGEGGEHDRT